MLPLRGLRIVELGHYIAGPFATRLLADLGAEVIKVEPPEGDPIRGWGSQVNGNAVWFSVHGRNKLSVTLDLADAVFDAGYVLHIDAAVENMRDSPSEVVVPLSAASAGRSHPGRRYIANFLYHM